MFKYICASLCALNIAAFGMHSQKDRDCTGSALNDSSEDASWDDCLQKTRFEDFRYPYNAKDPMMYNAGDQIMHNDDITYSLVTQLYPYDRLSQEQRASIVSRIPGHFLSTGCLNATAEDAQQSGDFKVLRALEIKMSDKQQLRKVKYTQRHRSRSPFFISIGRLRRGTSSDVLAEHDAIWSAQKAKIAPQKGDTE